MEREMRLMEWSDYIDGARAAAGKLIDEYVKRKQVKSDKPYIEAELRYIMDSKDNMWQWLLSDGKFHYCNHRQDKNGKVIYCEAYLKD